MNALIDVPLQFLDYRKLHSNIADCPTIQKYQQYNQL
jgi:hypothetical protein